MHFPVLGEALCKTGFACVHKRSTAQCSRVSREMNLVRAYEATELGSFSFFLYFCGEIAMSLAGTTEPASSSLFCRSSNV